ncbi:hypothetical protein EDB85DRAFT_338155 [Lactarius pseudohatsudake]|nr:hypothetical protein EDB85DRAFT_338155 [Lactarius pseudohatsudake]
MLIIHSAALTAARSIWRAPSYHAQRRHLFKLPDLTSFPSPFADSAGFKPQTYHEHKVLPYTRRQLYAVVADVGSYASFLPFCTRSARSAPTDPPRPQHHPHLLAKRTKRCIADGGRTHRRLPRVHGALYEPRDVCAPRAVAVSSTPLFKMLETTWRFQPTASAPTSTSQARTDLDGATSSPRPESAGANDTGPTLLSLDLAFEFANPLHGAVSGAFFGKVSGLMVKAFEERCVKVYGPG